MMPEKQDGTASAAALEVIAAWCASPHSFSAKARQSAKHAIADTVACMLAGASDRATLAVRAAFAREIGTRGAAGVAGGDRAPAAVAALVNGTAAHALDFDDNFHGATTHASAVLVPALLAIGERVGATGAALIEAYLIGLEAQAAIGRGVNPSHYTAGWHSTSTVGCIGTAAATAWLRGLDETGISAAMSIAASMASGIKGQFGTPVKPLHAGLAARNAVEAALLAGAGMTGSMDILESSQGFLTLYGGPDPRGWENLSFGPMSIIETVGLATKCYPCCGSTHRAIDMVLDLKATHGFDAADVAGIEVLVAIAHARNLAFPAPRDEAQARFSMNYCLAVALLQDRLTLGDFTPAAIRREEVRALLPLTRMSTYTEAQERSIQGRLPHELTLRLRDGTELRESRLAARGTLALPLGAADRQNKFLDCASGTLSLPTAHQLYNRIDQFEALGTVNLFQGVHWI